MIDENLPFKMYSGCKIIKGFRRSIIYDLDRYCYYFIPNDLFAILKKHEGSSINQIKSCYGKSDSAIIDTYFKFLVELDVIFFELNKLSYFDKIDENYINPALLSNIIIEVERSHDWAILFEQFNEVRCKYLQLRFYSSESFINFLNFLSQGIDTFILSIEVLIPYSSLLKIQNLIKFFDRFVYITHYIIYDSPKNEIISSPKTTAIAHYTSQKSVDIFSSHKVKLSDFTFEISQYLESKDHHLFFNQSASLDTHGNIKQSIFSNKIFGNIYKNYSFLDAILLEEFKKYWYVSRDKISKCNVCEFRRMCMFSSEIYWDTENNSYNLTEECGYNPYNAKFLS